MDLSFCPCLPTEPTRNGITSLVIMPNFCKKQPCCGCLIPIGSALPFENQETTRNLPVRSGCTRTQRDFQHHANQYQLLMTDIYVPGFTLLSEQSRHKQVRNDLNVLISSHTSVVLCMGGRSEHWGIALHFANILNSQRHRSTTILMLLTHTLYLFDINSWWSLWSV